MTRCLSKSYLAPKLAPKLFGLFAIIVSIPAISQECVKELCYANYQEVQKLWSNPSVIFLDTRSEEEISVSRLHPKAINLKSLKKRMKQDPKYLKDKTVISYCTLGIRAKEEAMDLHKDYQDLKPRIMVYPGVYDWALNGGVLYKSDGSITYDVDLYSDGFVDKAMQKKLDPKYKIHMSQN